MSHIRTPLILDTSVMEDIARGDAGLIELVQRYDSLGQNLIAPSLAIAGVATALHGIQEAQDLLAGMARMDAVTVAQLHGVEQAFALVRVMNRTGLDPWDGHVAAIADASICPILTINPAKWSGPSRALDDPLHIIEITDDPD
ncbi:hypothetical protein GCM10009555_063940 [Acrocarpospora macrocephala]|uniref:PIN domain-containing protein n=1 Tax=Acrocarpospora macrocephala TaxID=150177 RepID=A0A5M3WKE4_9ACTN|nr:PIN domain-containing protein [Acrocarpospora macrocephala]GES07671.1 hypothetical protein Amac_012660 [Acrocarpospora macrocephala]